MNVSDYFNGLLHFGSTDIFKRAKELSLRFPTCEWCPFKADRLNGDCFKREDPACKDQLLNFSSFVGGLSSNKIHEIVETGESRCWDKLYRWLGTEFSYSSFLGIELPDISD